VTHRQRPAVPRRHGGPTRTSSAWCRSQRRRTAAGATAWPKPSRIQT